MNKVIENQLKQTKIASLSNFDYNTNTYHIPQYSRPRYEVNSCYLVRVTRDFIKNPNTNIAINMNHSTAPQHEYLKIFVTKLLGRLIYVDSLAFDMETKQDLSLMWSGWLDTELLTQIAKI